MVSKLRHHWVGKGEGVFYFVEGVASCHACFGLLGGVWLFGSSVDVGVEGKRGLARKLVGWLWSRKRRFVSLAFELEGTFLVFS